VVKGYFGRIRIKNYNSVCHWKQQFKNRRYIKRNIVHYQTVYTLL